MAVTLTGLGSLFGRLGKFASELNRVVSGYGSSLDTGIENIRDQFPDSTADAIAIEGLLTARDSYRTVHANYVNTLVSDMKSTVIEQVNRDTPLVAKTLSNALTVLATQMAGTSDSLNRPTTTAVVTPWASNKGNAVVTASLTDTLGQPLDLVFAETVTLTVSADTSNGGSQFAETLAVSGQPLRAAADYQWPGGSGAAGSFQITNALTNGLLTDGSFENWVSSTPVSWTVALGAATVTKDGSNIIRGTYALKITSDGSTLTSLKQQVATSILPNTVYALNLWAKMSALDGSGAVRFRLTDSGGTVLVDDAGNSLSYSRNTNGQIGTSFTQVVVFFSTPRQLPASGGVWLEIAFTTAPANAKILYVDHVALVAATQLYRGGPFVAGFSKDSSNAIRDYFSLAVTNDLGTHSYVREMDRWLDLRLLGVTLPSATSETVPDDIT